MGLKATYFKRYFFWFRISAEIPNREQSLECHKFQGRNVRRIYSGLIRVAHCAHVALGPPPISILSKRRVGTKWREKLSLKRVVSQGSSLRAAPRPHTRGKQPATHRAGHVVSAPGRRHSLVPSWLLMAALLFLPELESTWNHESLHVHAMKKESCQWVKL